MPFRHRPLSAFLLALLLAACGDSPAEPGASLGVVVSYQTGPSVAADGNGGARISCEAKLDAIASGSGSVYWQEAMIRWYGGTDRSTPVDSTRLSPQQVAEGWGAEALDAGETLFSTWTFSADFPFDAEIEYRYASPPAHRTRTTTARVTCAPPADPAGASPTISSIEIIDGRRSFQPGETIGIRYQISSLTPLWQSMVALSGPCQMHRLFAEELQHNVIRSVEFTLPSSCRIGEPLSVAVYALDGVGRESARVADQQIVLVDLIPPHLTVHIRQASGMVGPATLSGEYFAGDSIHILAEGADNHALDWLIWEVLPHGARDSIPITLGTPLEAGIPLRPEWVGSIQLRLFVRDRAGLESTPIVSSAAKVLPTIERVIRWAPIDGEIRDVAFDQGRGVLYVLQPLQRRIAIVSLATMQVMSTIPLPASTGGFDLTQEGDSLLVTLTSASAIGVIDLRPATRTVEIVQVGPYETQSQWPRKVRAAANGKALFTIGGPQGPASARLGELDLATRTHRVRADAGETPPRVMSGYLERSHDRSMIMFAPEAYKTQRYDAATGTFGPIRATPSYDFTPSVDRTGQRIAVGLDIYDASMQLLRQIRSVDPAPYYDQRSAMTPDGGYLFELVSTVGAVRYSVVEGRALDRTRLPTRVHRARISADGSMLVAWEDAVNQPSDILLMELP